jgi:hypothetical protein
MSDALAELHQLEKETRALMRASQALRRVTFSSDSSVREDLTILEGIIERHSEAYFNAKRNCTWKRLEGFDGFWLNQNGVIEQRRHSDLLAELDEYVIDEKLEHEGTVYRLWYNGEGHRVTVLSETDEEGWPKVKVA